ncbi:branched-chain amino acid ABC transporter permease [Rhodoferax sp.]|uniref:branched-chain amino acid ABC transporter permease n=1 Tax=Rhodoferax sp. TaxID=50421 RepID=UPI00261C0C0D|nr:branched-chain amino acid ABC transporter permease [Rhodoferax sp.]MDD3935256.1 branched-chain amino acid ABC transporter permease [Rhodoferax sp.]
MLAQQILNGLISGAIYALFALGFNLIFGVQKVLNLAHGAIFMSGAFVAYYGVVGGLPLWLSILVAMAVCAAFSVLLDRFGFQLLRKYSHADAEFGAMVISIGVGQVLTSMAQKLSDTRVLSFPFGTFPVEFYRGFGLRISLLQITIAVLVVILVAFLAYFLQRTTFGRQVRAVAINPRASALLGINARLVFMLTFSIAGAMAAIAGVMIALSFNSIQFMMGEPYMLKAFVVVVLGGLGNLGGAVLASLLLGMAQAMSAAFLPPGLTDILIFSTLFVVLIFKPNGLFGGAVAPAGVGRQ